MRVGERRHDRHEIQKAVGHVKRDDAGRLDVLRVQRQRFGRDQMHRDRVAREGIDREDVEVGGRLALERQARVTERRLDGRFALPEIREVLAGRSRITAGLMS